MHRCPNYDVIIVGARCAGAATAMLLARSGLRTLVLDQERPGRDTLSTHALMRGAVGRLDRWGLLDAVRRAGVPALAGSVFHYGDGHTETVDARDGALYAPRRTVLDPLLVNAAVRAGAHVRHRVRVTGVLRDAAGRVIGVTGRDGREGRDGGGRALATAPLIVGADGARSTIARAVDAATTHRGRAVSAVAYRYWRGIPANRFHWYYSQGAAAGVIPTGDGLACVWVGAPTAELDRLRDDRRALAATAPELAEQLRRADPVGPVRAHPGSPARLRVPVGPGWALVGDAGYLKDPVTAHGITDALRDAELLARAVVADRDGDPDAFTRFHRTRDALSHDLLAVTERIAGYRWDLGELRELLMALSRAQRAENTLLATLDDAGARAA